ncbi:hypothetical protein TNCT_113201 [Trichonephila clavata]|uniref:Uncharacterized protein n=1 Tax=Trichonephila clavata TaxID=2740835 RepID=A0A8X6KIU2_TRICU|nr:hypothetical protein TNCT_113201 [Trichonephila clavata]
MANQKNSKILLPEVAYKGEIGQIYDGDTKNTASVFIPHIIEFSYLKVKGTSVRILLLKLAIMLGIKPNL